MKRTSFDLCAKESCQVHSGFLAASMSLSAGIEAALEKLGGKTRALHVAGQSLGGPLAQLGAFSLAHRVRGKAGGARARRPS